MLENLKKQSIKFTNKVIRQIAKYTMISIKGILLIIIFDAHLESFLQLQSGWPHF